MMQARTVLVAGGGMSGMCAAVAAAEKGADVQLLEKSGNLGGSFRLSGGLVWTYSSMDIVEELIPNGDAGLQDTVLREIDSSKDWLAKFGVEIGRAVEMPHGGRGHEIAPRQAIQALRSAMDELGVEVLTSAAFESISTSTSGLVTGVDARVAASERVRLQGDALVLATGGFQGNAELITRYLGIPAENVLLRANRWSNGDGLLAALQLGASVSPGLTHFYGHALAAPPASYSPADFREASQYYGAECVALNLAGNRFVDEAGGTGEEHVNEALARQPQGRGYYVLDAEGVASTTILGLSVEVMISRAVKLGAPYVKANSIEELCEQLSELGLPRDDTLRTLIDFNERMARSDTRSLYPPRSSLLSLSKPPFYAVGVQAAITFTMGGLAVDESMNVLSRNMGTSLMDGPIESSGGHRTAPIPGLFAAGCDLGGISSGGYMGGLAAALVTGRVAGQSAAEHFLSER